jgi:dTDP-3,4-didehydro-2,6-dideoxy-alpha-D-glucose 3-reductase
MSGKIRIGVLGCANIAENSVIPAIKSLTNKFDLVAVASRSISKAESFAKNFNCEAIEGYSHMVNSNEIDALYIPLPTGLHKEWINKALLAGKHVYAEKSIASDFAGASGMVEKARQNNLALMEGFMFQYHSQHKIVFELIKNGEIGELRYFSSSFGFPPLANNNFRYDDFLGGGALMDAGGYPVRATHFIMGNDLKVKGATLYIDPDLNTNVYGSAFLTNSKGIGAAISFGFDNYYQCRYEIWGEKGKIIADRAFTPKINYKPKIIIEKPEGTKVIEAEPDNHFIKAFEEFHNVIKNVSDKERHYSDILLQSRTLEDIKLLSK